MSPQDDLRSVIRQEAPRLHTPDGMDSAQLLAALADVESTFGLNAVPNHEPAYDEGGRYFASAQHVRDLHKAWGAWAACSYGPWQILFVLAWEMGFRGTPGDLWTAAGSVEWVIRALNARALDKGAATVADVGDAWNSGTHRDANRVPDYRRKIAAAYARPELLDPFGSKSAGTGGG